MHKTLFQIVNETPDHPVSEGSLKLQGLDLAGRTVKEVFDEACAEFGTPPTVVSETFGEVYDLNTAGRARRVGLRWTDVYNAIKRAVRIGSMEAQEKSYRQYRAAWDCDGMWPFTGPFGG